MPLAGGTFTGDVVFDNATHAGFDLTWDMSDKALEFDDNVKAKFGDGGDLEIWHDAAGGNYSYIFNNGAALLKIGSDQDIVLGKTSNENYLIAKPDGAVELYYDNNKKFESLTNGTKTTGNHYITGDLYAESEINMLTSTDSNKFLDVGIGTNAFAIRKTTGGDSGHENMIRAVGDGAVELYYNGVKKLETSPSGVIVSTDAYFSTDNGAAYFGASNDLKIFHNGSNSIIEAVSTGGGDLIVQGTGKKVKIRAKNDEDGIVVIDDGGVELYYDNTLTCYTSNGCLSFPDNQKIFMGASNDLQIFHDATTGHSRIKDAGAGNLALCSSKLTVWNAADNEAMMEATENGAVELYYDNSKKLETKSTGVKLTGEVEVTSNLLLKSSWSQRLYFGANNDLQIYHNGTNGQIDNNTGNLELRNTGSFGSERQLQIKAKVDENSIVCKSDGPVELYHNNSKKLETTSAGGTLTGTWNVGKILNYTWNHVTSQNTINSGNNFDNLSAYQTSITPSATSSRIIITVHIHMGQSGHPGVQIFRGSTMLGQASSNGSRRRATFAGTSKTVQNCDLGALSFTYVDHPNTTSSITYYFKISSGSGHTMRINYSDFGGNAHGLSSGSSVLLQEIAT